MQMATEVLSLWFRTSLTKAKKSSKRDVSEGQMALGTAKFPAFSHGNLSLFSKKLFEIRSDRKWFLQAARR